MTMCTVEQRGRCQSMAASLELMPCVIGADAIRYDDRWCVEATVSSEHSRVPPEVLLSLASSRFGIVDVGPQGEPAHYMIIAR